MIKALCAHEPAIRFGYERLRRTLDIDGVSLLDSVDTYLATYALWHGLDVAQVAKAYMDFSGQYAIDLKAFVESGKYPAEAGAVSSVDRRTYDIFLIVSVLTTPHRFSVMRHVVEAAAKGESALVFGVGSGLELALLHGQYTRVTACDLSVAPFVREQFPHVDFVEGDFFDEGVTPSYDSVYAVEVLEHVAAPYVLLEKLGCTVSPSGRLVVTTAANVPQFDHLANFPDDGEFPQKAEGMGLFVCDSARIPHDYRMQQVDAHNMFYLLGKETCQ